MVGDRDRVLVAVEMEVEIKRYEFQAGAHLGVRVSRFDLELVLPEGTRLLVPSRTWSWGPTYLCEVCDRVMCLLSVEDALVGGMYWVAPSQMGWAFGWEKDKCLDQWML